MNITEIHSMRRAFDKNAVGLTIVAIYLQRLVCPKTFSKSNLLAFGNKILAKSFFSPRWEDNHSIHETWL